MAGNRFTTALTAHDVSKAVALADQVIVLRDGLIALYIFINLPRSLRSISNVALGFTSCCADLPQAYCHRISKVFLKGVQKF
jgi:ABC-type nitrate/sulfonate/bicarbonate transport system ATPase subunit